MKKFLNMKEGQLTYKPCYKYADHSDILEKMKMKELSFHMRANNEGKLKIPRP